MTLDEIMEKAIYKLLTNDDAFSCHCIRYAVPIRNNYENREISHKLGDLYAEFIDNYLHTTDPECSGVISMATMNKYELDYDDTLIQFRLAMLKDFRLALGDNRVDFESNTVNKLCEVHDV